MDKFLKQRELISNDADSYVYYNKGELHSLLGNNVDDGIIASLYPDYITSILNYLETNFKVIKERMEYFVGFQIERDLFSASIFVYQNALVYAKLTLSLLRWTHMPSLAIELILPIFQLMSLTRKQLVTLCTQHF